jgi:GDP-L-fucose synthase
MRPESRIYIAGHAGMVGGAILRQLQSEGHKNFTFLPVSAELDLRDQNDVREFFMDERPDYVFLCAAKVGGIQANMDHPVDFLLHNLQIQNNVMSSAAELGVKKLMFMGSSCIYPRNAPQPMPESCLLTSPLEPSNESYALAKIAGLKLAQAYCKHGKEFISVMPTNLYGPGDNYKPGCHVIPGLIDRFHKEACKGGFGQVTVWGSGNARREFLHCDDLARACVLLMRAYRDPQPINIGFGSDVTISDLAVQVAKVVGLEPTRLTFDPSKPEGPPVKRVDTSKMQALFPHWHPRYDLHLGLESAYGDYLTRHAAQAQAVQSQAPQRKDLRVQVVPQPQG